MAALEQQRKLLKERSATALSDLENRIVDCRQCPRLVEWREEVAITKRASFADDEYWGRPVPGFGDPGARIVVIGLAPAAHGANRTGRMFTGDRSGEWLYRALHKAGLASQPDAVDRLDGLTMTDTWITSPVKCAPPANKPTPLERDSCASWFDEELGALASARVFVALGQYGYRSLWSHLGRAGRRLPSPRPKFAHGSVISVDELTIVLSYHVSQQNTFTGRLTEEMLDEVFESAIGCLDH
jgi:uracil-DNA glycosylase family 4